MPVSESEIQELLAEMDRWPDDSLVYRLAAALSAVHQQLREAQKDRAAHETDALRFMAEAAASQAAIAEALGIARRYPYNGLRYALENVNDGPLSTAPVTALATAQAKAWDDGWDDGWQDGWKDCKLGGINDETMNPYRRLVQK